MGKARLKGHLFNITVISAYALTRAADESIVDEFYDALTQSLRTVPNRDLLILEVILMTMLEAARQTAKELLEDLDGATGASVEGGS